MKSNKRRKLIAAALTLTMLIGSVQTTFANTGENSSNAEFIANYFQADQEAGELKAIEAEFVQENGNESEISFNEGMTNLETELDENGIAGQKSAYLEGDNSEEKSEGIVKIVIDAAAQLETTTPVDVMFVVDHSGTMNSNITPGVAKSSDMVNLSATMNPNLLYRTVYKITDTAGAVSYVTYYFNPHEFTEGIGNWNVSTMKNAIDKSFKEYVANPSNNIDEALENKINTGSYSNQADEEKGYIYQLELYKYADGVTAASNSGRIFDITDDYVTTKYVGFTTEEKRSSEEKKLYEKMDSLMDLDDVHTTEATVTDAIGLTGRPEAGNVFMSPYALSSDPSKALERMNEEDFNYDRLYLTKAVTMDLANKLITENSDNRVGTVNFAGEVDEEKSIAKLDNYEGGKNGLPAAFYDTAGYFYTNWTAGLKAAKEDFVRINEGEKEASDRNQYVVFVSDGKPTINGVPATTIDELQAMGIEVISVGINLTTADYNTMKSLGADQTVNVSTAEEFQSVFNGINAITTSTPISPIITDEVGEGFDLLIDGDHPLTLNWIEGATPRQATIESQEDLADYGIVVDGKKITWDTSKVNEESDSTVVSGARISFYQDFDEEKIDVDHFTEEKTSLFETNGDASVKADINSNGDTEKDEKISLSNPGTIKVSGLSTITLEKTSNPVSGSTVEVGDAIEYTLTLQNKGNVDVKGLEINDFIPEGTGNPTNATFDEENNKAVFLADVLAEEVVSQSFTVSVTEVEEGFVIENIAYFGLEGNNFFLNKDTEKLELKSGKSNNSFDEEGNPALKSNTVTHTLVSEELIVTPDPTPIPVPPTPPAPLALVIPPGVAEVIAISEAITIADEPTTIEDAEAPLARGGAAWSLLDLILTIVTGLLAVSLLITYFTGRKEEDEEEYGEVKRKGLLRILSAVPMIGAIILFILTQDMTLPMIIVDEWTIVFAAITLVQAGITFFSRKTVEEDEESMA